jgi:hypothetical protein
VQLYGLEHKSLWHDEFGTLTNAGYDGGWIDAIRNPLTVPTLPKPPLSFLVTHAFLRLGQGALWARLPSVLFALLTIPLNYTVGSTLFARRTGLLAALLLAIAPLHVRYAQEARMYSMLAFLSILTLYLFWWAIRSRNGRWWAGFALATTANLYTHQFAILPLGVLVLFGVGLMIAPRARAWFPFRRRQFFLSLVAILLLYLPMVPFIVEGVISEEGLGGQPVSVYGELSLNLGSLLSTFRLLSGGTDPALIASLILVGTGLVGFALHRVKARRRRRPSPAGSTQDHTARAGADPLTGYAILLLLIWIVLPLVAALVFPAGHGVRIRYLLFILPAYLLLVGYGLSWLLGRLQTASSQPAVPTAAAVLMLVGIFAITGPSLTSYYAETKQNWRDATYLVLDLALPGEPVFVTRLHHQTGVRFYGGGEAGDVRVMPKDPAEDLLPSSTDTGWLITPVREQYAPGEELDARLQPHFQLSDPVVFAPAHVPLDSPLIGPIIYRSLAVMEITRIKPASVSFRAEQETIQAGECTRLHWNAENIAELYLDGGGVVGHDSREVCPDATTRYELKAVLQDGSERQESVEISVIPPED